MKELSVFADDTGDQGGQSKYYAITLVLHEQQEGLDEVIAPYAAALRYRNHPDIPFHASPLMNGHDAYASMELSERKSMFGAFFELFRHLPITYKTFLYRRSEIGDSRKLEARMRRDVVNFLFDHLTYFQSFDRVKIYYDYAQQPVSQALHDAFDYAIAGNAALYRKAAPEDYRLAQAADLLCTLELTAEKYRRGEQTRTDEKFFGSAGSFRNNYMKAAKRKRFR